MTATTRRWTVTGPVLGCAGSMVVGVVVLVMLSSVTLRGCHFDVGPGTGTDSLRLAIAVAPATGLGDGTVVRVTSSAFAADTVVGVAVCLREADTKRKGVADCDKVSGARYATDGAGHLDATFSVPRVITVAGRAYDCAATTARCILVAADASDFNTSGGQPIAFRSGLPHVPLVPHLVRPGSDQLPIVGTPVGAVPPGALIQVTARGFQPGEPLIVARCIGIPDATPGDACEPLNLSDAVLTLMLHSVKNLQLHANADGTFTIPVAAAATVKPYVASAPTDCAAAPGRCTIVVAAAADTKRSAVLPYTLSRD